MSKKSHRGIAALAKNTNKSLRAFSSRLKELGFRKRTEREKLIEMVEQGVRMPKRATSENATQDQWIRTSASRYDVIIHTGMIKNEFIDCGSSWVLIRNENKKAVFSREFYRRNPVNLLEKLTAHAHLCANISDGRLDGDELLEVSENKYEWRSMPFRAPGPVLNYKNYLPGLSTEEKEIVSQKERIHDAYLKNTFGKVRREKDFRSTWKD
jgi:hypothetical protein